MFQKDADTIVYTENKIVLARIWVSDNSYVVYRDGDEIYGAGASLEDAYTCVLEELE